MVEHPFYTRKVKCSNHLFLNIILRDLSLKVKYVTFNHYDTGSNPVDLLKKSLLLIEQISCNYIIYKK